MGKRQSTFAAAAAVMTALMVSVAPLSAQSSLEAAKKLYDEGKYAECVKALENDLKNGGTSVDALKLAMNANVKSGDIMSASANATELLKRTQNKDADLVFEAAGIAELAGENKLALSRYHTYALAKRDTNDAKLMKALLFVIRNGTFDDVYKIYAEKRGASSVWSGLTNIMQRLLDAQDAQGFAGMYKFVASAYYDYPDVINEINRMLWNNRTKISDYAKILDVLTTTKMNPKVDAGPLGDYIVWAYGEAKLNEAKRFNYGLNFIKNSGLIPWNAGVFINPALEYVKSRTTVPAKAAAAKEFMTAAEFYEKGTALNPISEFVSVMTNNRDLFPGARPEMFARLAIRMDELVNTKYNDGSVNHIIGGIINNYYKDNTSGGVMFAKAALNALAADYANWLFRNDASNSDIKNKLNNNIEKYLARFNGFEKEFRASEITEALRDMGFVPQALDAMKVLMLASPYDGNWCSNVLAHANFPADAAIKTALDIYNLAGYNGNFQRLFEAMSKNKRFTDSPAFAAFKAAVDQKKAGSDPALTAAGKVFSTPNNQQNLANLERELNAFIAAYKGKFPGIAKQASNIQELAAFRVLERAWSISNDNAYATRIIRAILPRMKMPGRMMDDLLRKAINIDATNRKNGLLYESAKTIVPLVAANPESGFLGSWEIRNYNYAEQGKDFSVMAPLYTASPYLTEVSVYYIYSSAKDWTAPFFFGELVKILNDPKAEFSNQFLSAIPQMTTSSPYGKEIPAAFAEAYLKRAVAASAKLVDVGREISAVTMAQGKDQEALVKLYAQLIGARSSRDKVGIANEFFNRYSNAPYAVAYAVVDGILKPALAGLTDIDKAGLVFELNTLNAVARIAGDDKNGTPEGREAAKTLLNDVCNMILAGDVMIPSWNPQDATDHLVPRLAEIIKKGDNRAIAAAVSVLASCFERETNTWRGHNRAAEVYKMLEKSPDQIKYMFLTGISKGTSQFAQESKAKYMMDISRLGRNVPGSIAVDSKDPAYNLFLAVRKRAEGNQFDAWILAKDKISELTKRWKEFDLDFVIWALDSARKAQLYKEAIELAQTIWLDELQLNADSAAMIGMIKGDIYRDMKNYPAARIEYESLGNIPRYSKTEGGRMAKFRLIDLLILTQDYATARSQLERLVNSRSIDDQAEAYYMLAKIDFQQEELDLARENLNEVFMRNSQHVEAILLNGEIQLKDGRVRTTELEIGPQSLAQVIVPGMPVNLQIQDNNLSVIRGGKALPVVVRTTSGKDIERLELLPDAQNAKKFSGQMPTTIGKPVPGNGVIELNGSDEVEYMIDPVFQKANNLDYPPKKLTVKFSAKLYVSSQKILSEQEQDELALQEKLELTSGLRNRTGSDKIVRPGSPIYIRVVDIDRSVSFDKPDTISVKITCSSGDEIEQFDLVETGNTTGVFEGIVKTGIPFPNVTVSDAREDNDPNALININKPGGWISMTADAKNKAKWVKIDTMTSYEFKDISLKLENPSMLKAFKVYGSLDTADNELICEYPQIADAKMRGGLTFSMLNGNNQYANGIAEAFKRANVKGTYIRDTVARRDLMNGFRDRDGWAMFMVNGTFYLPEDKQLEFKFMQEPSDNNVAFFSLDGRQLLGGKMNKAGVMASRSIFLQKGFHTVSISGCLFNKDATVQLGMLQDDGTYKPLPSDWFSTEKNPELAEYLKPKGAITQDKEGFNIKLTRPERYRTIRFDFDDYNGNQLEIREVTATDVKGAKILPVEHDLAEGKTNMILEIAAADKITVAYADEKRTQEHNAILTENLSSSFHDASISFAYEDVRLDEDGFPRTYLASAVRAQKGDSIIVTVNDNDVDTSDERETVKVLIETSSGEKIELELLETGTTQKRGVFQETFKLGDVTDQAKRTIKLNPGDTITGKYLDEENNKPGIPFYRTVSIVNTTGSKPEITVYSALIKLIEDKSEAAIAKIRMMRARGDKRPDIKIFKETIEATAIIPETEADKNAVVIVNSKTPLLFELMHPEIARHNDSKATMEVLTKSEIDAAEREQREPVPLEVEMKLQPLAALARSKGYTATLKSSRGQGAITELGLFSGLVRLQLGSPGDEVNDAVTNNDTYNLLSAEMETFGGDADTFKVPTIIVSGSDIVYLTFKDKGGKELAKKTLQLRSDGEIGLFDKAYASELKDIHLGQSFNVRVYDPDRDVSNDRDTVDVEVVSSSGDKVVMKLSETLVHSGVFTGSLKTELKPKPLAGQEAPAKIQNNVLWGNFGDKVTFTYIDDRPLEGGTPLDVKEEGIIVIGSDGELAAFTKKFKDPDMAVKTNFLMAEALFEMAKSHKAIDDPAKKELAKQEIARGKRVLEEALRDYPDTTLKAQGEFLLANLALQLENFNEALSLFSMVISKYPDSDFAPRSYYQKALCYEKLAFAEEKEAKERGETINSSKGELACEEFVKITYLYPDSNLAPEAKLRLGNYYYKMERFKLSASVFEKFAANHPDHERAATALLLAGYSAIKNEQAKAKHAKETKTQYKEDYTQAIRIFSGIVDKYESNPTIRAEAMYWLGDCLNKRGDEEGKIKCYQIFQRITWDYPDTKWAKYVRARMAEQPIKPRR